MTGAANTNRPSQAFIPPRYYAALVSTLSELGYDRDTFLAEVGVDAKLLASEEAYLTLDQVETLVGRACEMENTDDLGLRVGQGLQLMSHGALSVAALTAPTPREGLQTVVEFFALIIPVFALEVHDYGVTTGIRLTDRFPLSPEVERFHTATISGSIYAQLRFLLGGAIPAGVELLARHPRPPGLPEWVDDAGVALNFDQPHYEIRVPTSALSVAMPFADPRAHELGRQRCMDLLDAMPDPTRLSSAVARLLLEHGPPFLSLESVSRSLSLSGRSLRRRLEDEGTSFREVLDGVRLSLADKWLGDSSRTITDIGISLGYADASNFARAYRRARGKSATQARAEISGEASGKVEAAARKR